MTHAAPRKRGGRTWTLPALAALVVAASVVAGVLSRSIAVDVASWWPVWFALLAAWLAVRGRKFGRLRAGGLVSIVSVAIAVVFVVAHLQGWSLMPSSAGVLSGSPDTGFVSAGLSARIPDGDVVVESGAAGALYSVEPLRRGGDVALPFAVERSQDGDVSVVLTPAESPGLFLWAGWKVHLSAVPAWTLTLEGRLDADLAQLAVANLQVSGSGTVRLGTVNRSTPASVFGDFLIYVPEGAPVRVVGPAQIPGDWTRTDVGASSPSSGQGWVISVVEGSVVEIRVR